MVLKILAHTCFGAGLTVWFDLFRGCTFSADQIVGLTVMITIACLIVGEIARTIKERQPQRVDVRSYFEEVK